VPGVAEGTEVVGRTNLDTVVTSSAKDRLRASGAFEKESEATFSGRSEFNSNSGSRPIEEPEHCSASPTELRGNSLDLFGKGIELI